MYQRIPIAVRAIVSGLVVQIVGVMPFLFLAQLNMTILPSVPWSAFVEWILLLLFVKYFRGWGAPESTQATRRTSFRANVVPGNQRTSIAVLGGLVGLTVLFLVVLGNQLVSMPAEALGMFVQLAEGPPLMAITMFATVAVMTGVVEEVAFRGYMQVPLERRYGPVVGILIVALMFSLVHFPPLFILPLYLIGAIGWGLLARIANSTLPGMIVHALVDFTFFMWILSDTEAVLSLLESSVLATGVDAAFLLVAALTTVFVVATVLIVKRYTADHANADHGLDGPLPS